DVYMADFEDSHSPTWRGTIQGQFNLRDAVNRSIEHTSLEGKTYRLNKNVATLCVRPRGLHLPEKHVLMEGEAIPAAFFDFGLYLYHNHKKLREQGTGPYYYLPKLENHLEARLWNDVFDMSEQILGLPANSIKCTVLIENILAAFEMDKVIADKTREVEQGFDGAWVAHPDLVPVVMKVFNDHMTGPNQLDVKHEGMRITSRDLLHVPKGPITEAGIRANISVSLRYL